MNLTKAQKIRLGIFVVAGSAVLAGSLITLAGLKTWQPRDLYVVRFTDSVSGLERSAQVRYQGLRVGRVESMRVAPDDPAAIEVTLALDPHTILYSGSTAVLDVSGITGLKTINLTPGDPRGARIAPGSLIPSGVSFVDRLTGEAEQISLKAELVANQLAKWTSDENRARFERLLNGSAKLAEDIDQLVVEAHKPAVMTLEEVAKSGSSIRSVAEEGAGLMREVRTDIKSALTDVRSAIEDADRILKAVDPQGLAETLKSTRSAVTNLDRRVSAEEFGRTIHDLEATLASLSKLLSEVDLTVRASRNDFVDTLAHLRQATVDLREFSRVIAQDPSSLIRGKEVER